MFSDLRTTALDAAIELDNILLKKSDKTTNIDKIIDVLRDKELRKHFSYALLFAEAIGENNNIKITTFEQLDKEIHKTALSLELLNKKGISFLCTLHKHLLARS